MKDRISSGRIILAFAAPAIAALLGITGYLFLSHKPLTRDQLTDVIGHVDRWTDGRHQAPGTAGGAPPRTADLTLYTKEHRAPLYVSHALIDGPKCFNAAAFEKDVKQGDTLVLTVRNRGVELKGSGRIALAGIVSPKAVYLNVDCVMAYDALQRQRSRSWFFWSLVLLALLLAAARMLWLGRKKSRQE